MSKVRLTLQTGVAFEVASAGWKPLTMTYVTNHGLMYKGVSQGAVLGRLLCNIIHNDMLRLSAAADSCLRRRHHHHISQVEAMTNDVVACVKTRLDTASLDFVEQ